MFFLPISLLLDNEYVDGKTFKKIMSGNGAAEDKNSEGEEWEDDEVSGSGAGDMTEEMENNLRE